MTTDPTIEAYDCRLLDAPPDLDLPRERTRFCALLPRGGRVLDYATVAYDSYSYASGQKWRAV